WVSPSRTPKAVKSSGEDGGWKEKISRSRGRLIINLPLFLDAKYETEPILSVGRGVGSSVPVGGGVSSGFPWEKQKKTAPARGRPPLRKAGRFRLNRGL